MAAKNTGAERKGHSWWERLHYRYRLIVLNDETLEEVTSVQLTKKSLYIMLCTLFVVLALLTGSLLAYTPLRYYIPGYGDQKQRKEYIQLNMRADSLERLVTAQARYLENIRQVLHGQMAPVDTALLPMPKVEHSTH